MCFIPLLLVTACDRNSARKVGRALSDTPSAEAVEKPAEVIAGFVEGTMEKVVQDQKKRSDAAIEEMNRTMAERQKKRELERIRSDKGFPGHSKSSGFSSHGKDMGFPSHSK